MGSVMFVGPKESEQLRQLRAHAEANPVRTGDLIRMVSGASKSPNVLQLEGTS